METTYVTFGQDHKHVIGDATFDKDCIATIECNNAREGRQLAVDNFGEKFCTTYHENEFPEDSLKYFPRGFLEVPVVESNSGSCNDSVSDAISQAHSDLFDNTQKAHREYSERMFKILKKKVWDCAYPT